MTAAWREKPLRASERDKEMLMGDYLDILEELEYAAQSSCNLFHDIEIAMYDVYSDLESVESHLAKCVEKLRVFQPVKELFGGLEWIKWNTSTSVEPVATSPEDQLVNLEQ